MKKLILLLSIVCSYSTVEAMNSQNNDDLLGYAISTKYTAFARMLGDVQPTHAELTILTNVYPYSISTPFKTTASININLNQEICAEGLQHIPNKGDAQIYVKNCKLDTINGLQVLHGLYSTEASSGGADGQTKPDNGVININYPYK